jgi:hypothetical protein
MDSEIAALDRVQLDDKPILSQDSLVILKGTGFSPYIKLRNINAALAAEGMHTSSPELCRQSEPWKGLFLSRNRPAVLGFERAWL